MPLSAARGTWRVGEPVRLLNQGTFLERELLSAVGVEAPLAEPHGTVAATALDLALAATRGPVTLAGLDLCALDSETHVRPNAFDTLLRDGDDRCAPHHALAYARARLGESASRVVGGVRVRVSRSLETYAGWLSHRASAVRGRVFRLYPSPVDLPGAEPVDGARFRDLVATAPPSPPGVRLNLSAAWPPAASRRGAARGVLSRWSEILDRGAARARGGAWVEVLAESPELTDLAWHAAARDLIDAKRRQRLGDEQGAQAAAVRLLEDAGAFVRSLDARLGAGAPAP